jgi:hypothetical protein
MSYNFEHLLLTRFNLQYPYQDEYICDDNWHQHRFSLFYNYCLPSVLNQTNSEFLWIILFNKSLREKYRSFIEDVQYQINRVHFLYVRPGQDYREELFKFINNEIKTEVLITTRVDNDDIISIGYIKEIQDVFQNFINNEACLPCLVNAGNGYQAELNFPYRIVNVEGYSYSPFLSLISDKNNEGYFNTVVDKSHHLWDNSIATIEIGKKAWIQIIHQNNLSNHISSKRLEIRIPKPEFIRINKKIDELTTNRFILLPIQYLWTFVELLYNKSKVLILNKYKSLLL